LAFGWRFNVAPLFSKKCSAVWNEIASSSFVVVAMTALQVYRERRDIGAGGADVPPFLLIINAIVIAREERPKQSPARKGANYVSMEVLNEI
jgi:hypothetical protein